MASHTLKRCLVPTHATLNGDQPYSQALAGSTTVRFIHSPSNIYTSFLIREEVVIIVQVETYIPGV
jgi:hypothetical protein